MLGQNWQKLRTRKIDDSFTSHHNHYLRTLLCSMIYHRHQYHVASSALSSRCTPAADAIFHFALKSTHHTCEGIAEDSTARTFVRPMLCMPTRPSARGPPAAHLVTRVVPIDRLDCDLLEPLCRQILTRHPVVLFQLRLERIASVELFLAAQEDYGSHVNSWSDVIQGPWHVFVAVTSHYLQCGWSLEEHENGKHADVRRLESPPLEEAS
mmetsp:Transcript_21406/g.33786  ORF Transcript_21406/g.33786 Transcript_21406/m.33786 type:complete len:210 (-) Transcript_21406:629-1258(-)